MTNALLSFKTRETLSELLKLAWPVVLARLGIMTMGLTDAIVVGHYASRELAFHSLAWAPSSVVLTTAVGLMMGVQVMTARLLGEYLDALAQRLDARTADAGPAVKDA